RLGIWERVKTKIVYAENISMAKQFGASNNADAVFTAWSLVLGESGTVVKVDDNLHRPITQELGIIAASPRREQARRFVEFVLGRRGRELLSTHGYRVP